MSGGEILGLVLLAAIFFSLGWLSALIQVARDPLMHRVDASKAIVLKADLERLQMIAKVKTKTPSLNFDKDGHLKHQMEENDED